MFNIDERAKVLSSFKSVDYVITLTGDLRDQEYDKLILLLRPSVIAVTQGDPLEGKKRLQADSVSAKFAIIPHLKTHSTSKLARMLGID